MNKKLNYVLGLGFISLIGLAATPIENLKLQGDMDADSNNITNVTYIAKGDAKIDLSSDNVTVNPDFDVSGFYVKGSNTFTITSKTGTPLSGGSAKDLIRIGSHNFVSNTDADVVLHGEVEVLDDVSFLSNADFNSNNVSNVQSLQFTGGSGEQGKLSWNTDEDTLDLIEGDATLQLGQELHIHARNDTGSTISNGTLVSFAGTLGASSRIKVEPFLADGNTDIHKLIGVATHDIANGEDGKITHFGKVRGLDTSSYSAGAELYASSTSAGAFTTNAPASPAQAVVIAFVINSHASTGAIEVIPNWSDENALDTDWVDSGDILKSTNNTVIVSGSSLSANHDQLIVSNDVRVAFRVDEDGDAAFRSWYDDAVADGRSYAAWQEYFDFRHIVDYDEYYRIEGSTIEEMTFNMTLKNLDYIFNGDNKENLLYMDADTDSVNIHTNSPVAGYGFTVATNAIFTASDAIPAVTIDDILKITPRSSAPTSSLAAGLVFYHSTSNSLFVYDGTNWNNLAASGGGGSGISLTDLSVSSGSAGDGTLEYDDTTGVFTMNEPTPSGIGAITSSDLATELSGYIQSGMVDTTEFQSGVIVDEASGISSNDDDSTIPTSAAVIDYVSSNALLSDSSAGTDGFVSAGSSYTSSSVVIAPEGEPITPTSGAAQFVAIGAGGSWIVNSTADDQFAAVGNNIDTSYRSALLGYQVDSGIASGAIGIGYDADIAGNYGVAIGYQTKTTTDGVAIGYRAESKQRVDAVAIGSDSNAGDDGVIAIGAHADVRNDDSAFGADSVIVIGDTMRINDSVEYEPFMQVGANDKAWWEAGPNTPYNYLTDANYTDDRDFDTEAWTRTAYRIFNEEGDPTEPAANHSVLWVADGTGTRGDEGDLVIAVNDGTSTKWKILFDFSAEGNTW